MKGMNAARVAYFIFGRRSRRGFWIYLLAALPFALFSAAGSEYCAFLLYLFPLGACLIQAAWPTLLGWLAVLSIYLTGFALYLVEFIRDLWSIFGGGIPRIFVDFNDSAVFIGGLLVLAAISAGLAYYRPRALVPGESRSS